MTPELAIEVLRNFMEDTRKTFGRTFPLPSEAIEVLATYVARKKNQ